MSESFYGKYKKVIWIAGLAVLALIALLAVWQAGRTQKITVTPVDADSEGVAPDSAFVIAGSAGDDISVSPEIAFLLQEEGTPDTYLLTPTPPLAPGSDFTITVQGVAFGFKVRNQLLVTGSFPARGAVDVPLNAAVELSFNADVEPAALNEALTVSPPLEGSFERQGERLVFRPADAFVPYTEYVFTLAAGLTGAGDAALREDWPLAFTTTGDRSDAPKYDLYISSAGRSLNFLPGEVPHFQAYANGFFDEDPSVSVEVKKFDGWELFRDALALEEGREIPAEGLSLVSTFETAPFRTDDHGPVSVHGSGWQISMPEALEPGWYAVSFSAKAQEASKTVTTLVQVSDLSVYYMTADRDLAVWINDVSTGLPVGDAQVSFEGDWNASTSTDERGVAVVREIPMREWGEDEWQHTAYSRFTVTAGDRVFVGDSSNTAFVDPDSSGEARHAYMAYLYTDRSIYRTTDTIRVWGVIRPRDPQTAPPTHATLTLGKEVITAQVELKADGSFKAELPLEAMTPTFAPLVLSVPQGDLDQLYLTIEDFVKPVYTAEETPHRPVWLMTGEEEPSATLRVTLFDGTPAAQYPVRLEPNGGDIEIATPREQRVTDRDGYLPVALRITNDPDTWYPVEYSYYASGNEAAQENFSLYGVAYAIHRDVVLTGRPIFGEESDSVEIATHRVDISRVKESADLWEEDILLGAALSQEVTAEIHRVYFDKTPDGNYYDFMDKEWKERFRYLRNDVVEEVRDLTTQNGSVLLEGLPKSNWDEAYYYVVLSTQDSLGRWVRSETHLGSLYGSPGIGRDGVTRYTLDKMERMAGSADATGSGYRYQTDKNTFEDSEAVSFELRQNDAPMASAPGRLLSLTVQDGIDNLRVDSNAVKVTLPYGEELLPNYTITGAYFDGERVFALDETRMRFNPKQRELSIELATDKESYQPGEDMAVTATVRNKYTGAPAQNATVLLSVVDEAIFAVQEQYIYLLSDLYQSVYHPAIHQYTSYSQNIALSGAEKGGGGGSDSIREDFADTPYFDSVTTGADGKATARVTLPDNITSWRMTTLAITPQNHAGQGKDNISATLDYFVTPIIAPQLLAGDSCAVGLYSAGVGVAPDDPVSYTVLLEGNGIREEKSASSTVRGYASVELGALAAGDYTVTVRGSSGSYTDGVALPIQVVPSGIEVSLTETFRLKDGIELSPLRWPISVNLYGENTKNYNAVFRTVASRARGSRAEARLAARYVATVYSKSGVKWYDQDALSADISDLTGRAMSKLPQSQADVELCVRAVLALPDSFSDYYLQSLYYGPLIDGDPYRSYEGRDCALYLAQALTQPERYADLEGQIRGSNLDYVDQVYLAMAMQLTGNEAAAGSWYDTLVTQRLKVLKGASGEEALYVVDPAGRVSDMECTAAASIFATLLRTDDAHGLARYLADKQEEHGEAYLLEMIYYLEQFPPAGGESASLRYTRGGEIQTLTLDRWLTPLSFTKEQLEEASFEVTGGEILADVYYAGAPQQIADGSRRLIPITKTVEPYQGNTIEAGSLVKITLTPDLSSLDLDIGSAQLVIDDYLPTGMRFERYSYAQEEALAEDEDEPESDPNEPQEPEPEDPRGPGGRPDKGWYLVSRQGQRLRFSVYGAGSLEGFRPIVYYARCATPGTYVVESAYVTSASSDLWGASDRATVQIK